MFEVYDIETLASCFTYTGYNIKTKEVHQFVLHKDRFELDQLIDHLSTLKGQIGFNNLTFDYPIIHFIIENIKSEKWRNLTKPQIITVIYKEAQRIINLQDDKLSHLAAIKEYKSHIKQLDLFKIWHFDNKAKSTGLKALEISMNYPNVLDMPFEHDKIDIRLEDIESILEYNLNDVMATYRFYEETIKYDKVQLRKKIQKDYNLPCLNWNNGKIGENLILKLYCDKTGADHWETKKLRSNFTEIALNECIPSIVEFKTKEFNYILDSFRNKIVNVESIDENKKKGANAIASIIYKDCVIDYGLGGVHGITRSGVYISDKKYIIKSADVASLYPNFSIIFNFYITHLGPEFLEVYRDNIVYVRMNEKLKPKAEQDKSIVDGFKEAANIPFGKSKDKNSFLYDPSYFLKTTVGGQLVTSMLCEELGTIPECKVLMYNTDGLEVLIPREYEKMYEDICSSWEEKTMLKLEYVDYEKMWIADVNNYGAITTTDKIKNKGRFEVDKVIGTEPAYHKDNSFRIIPIAIQEFFTKGIDIEETIKNHKNIYDFCGRQKFNRDSYGEIHYISGLERKVDKQQKNTRYYISTNGNTFIKQYKKGSSEVINKGYRVTIFNEYIEKEISDYNINYSFYINECYKEIQAIETNQLELFEEI